MYRVKFLRSASKFYLKATKSLRKRIDRCIEQLKSNPYNHPNIKKLTAEYKHFMRYRLGDYRIIYNMEEENKLIVIVKIAVRSKSY